MAKYTFTYACGHGEGTVDIGGKVKDRENKRQWYANTMVCPECYKKEMQEKTKEMGIVFSGGATPNPSPNIVLSFTGDIQPEKDKIKALGYQWSEVQSGGLFGYLSTKKAPYGYVKVVHYSDLEAEIERVKEAGIPVKDWKFDISEIDIALMAKKAQEEREIEEKIATLQKPQRPEVLKKAFSESPKEATWNCKIYRDTIYIANRAFKVTGAEKKELELYLAAKEEYSKKVKEIKNGSK